MAGKKKAEKPGPLAAFLAKKPPKFSPIAKKVTGTGYKKS